MSQAIDYETPPLRVVDKGAFVKLCIMMFLQFFVWGAWYVTTSNYMTAHPVIGGNLIAWAYSVSPIAAIISPFFLGMVADRFFATEKVLAMLHLIGAVAMAAAPMAADKSAAMFVTMLGLHMLCYMPTIGLTNSIAFANLTNQEKQFPFIRVFGTLGWIAANLVVSGIKADKGDMQYYLAAGAGIVLAAFSLMLPHTPPPAKGKVVTAREIIGVDALAMLKHRSYLVFMVCAFFVCIPLAAYYAFANLFVEAVGVQRVAAVMSLGQMAEVLFMVLMPMFFAFLGARWMLAVGMLAWVVRYGLFATAAPDAVLPLVIAGILLHGICYDFFFVTAFIYTDKRSPKEIRGQAQGFLVLVTYGLGLLIGALSMGYVKGKIVTATGTEALAQWAKFWWIPCGLAAVVLLFFLALFRDDTKERSASQGT